MVRASNFDPKIDENRCRKAQKALKLWKNIFFGMYRFFIVFLMHFSMNFGPPGRLWGIPKIEFSASFFDFFARLSLQSCSWGLLEPFRVNFSSIFGWFWHDFGSISSCSFDDLLSVCCPSWADLGCFFLHAHAFQMFFLNALVTKKLWLGRPKTEKRRETTLAHAALTRSDAKLTQSPLNNIPTLHPTLFIGCTPFFFFTFLVVA